MPKTQQHTAADSFARGVQIGRKEVRDGDYSDALVGIAIVLGFMILSGVVLVKILRWLVH